MGVGDHNPGSQSGVADPRFTTTHWSVVRRAGQAHQADADEALGRLCQDYWYPLYAYVRRRGYPVEEAQDLTQEFFARLIAKAYVQQADRERGRFRTFLLTALSHFLANEWDKRQTVKRGGRADFVSWDAIRAEDQYRGEPTCEVTAEKLYDRRWALALIEGALEALRQEYRGDGREQWFEALEGYLADDRRDAPWAELGARLGLSEGAVKMRVQRLRRRFGELLRDRVAQTVAGPEQLEAEMQYLLGVWD